MQDRFRYVEIAAGRIVQDEIADLHDEAFAEKEKWAAIYQTSLDQDKDSIGVSDSGRNLTLSISPLPGAFWSIDRLYTVTETRTLRPLNATLYLPETLDEPRDLELLEKFFALSLKFPDRQLTDAQEKQAWQEIGDLVAGARPCVVTMDLPPPAHIKAKEDAWAREIRSRWFEMLVLGVATRE